MSSYDFWMRQTLRDKPAKILEDWARDKSFYEKQIQERDALIENFEKSLEMLRRTNAILRCFLDGIIAESQISSNDYFLDAMSDSQEFQQWKQRKYNDTAKSK